jgi:hypothetical protein
MIRLDIPKTQLLELISDDPTLLTYVDKSPEICLEAVKMI